MAKETASRKKALPIMNGFELYTHGMRSRPMGKKATLESAMTTPEAMTCESCYAIFYCSHIVELDRDHSRRWDLRFRCSRRMHAQ
nr:hypothetical protein Itr_chr08CG09870 [Ipomoea trifida]GMC64485.1 hypothetical protein Iba_chr02dCG5400 [Ipomoea batatas]